MVNTNGSLTPIVYSKKKWLAPNNHNPCRGSMNGERDLERPIW